VDAGAVVCAVAAGAAACCRCRRGRTRFGAGWVAAFPGVAFAVAVCAAGFSGALLAVLVFAPAVRANSEANATVAMALSCVARQVSRERRRMP
jgi:ABC-type branched-subunit amino acid transport system permease subunit